MNKEEMLNTLENIQRKMGEAKVSEYELQDRVEILENVFKLRERTERDIKYLTEKLSTDDNYIEKRPVLYDESRRFNLEDYIEACEKDEQANHDEIAMHEKNIENFKNQIMKSEKIIEELEQRLPGLGEELRDSTDMNEADFEKMRLNYANITSLRDAHKQNIIESQKLIERSEDRLESLKSSIGQLADATEEAKEILENFDKIQASVVIDTDTKKSDQNKLKVLEERLKHYSEVEDLVSYDYDKSIAQIISDYKEDKITSDEVVDKVKELRRYVVEDVLIDDIQARNEEVTENLEAQDACKKEITKLEEKLSNDDNYIPSIFVAERNNRQLEKMDRRIAGSEEQIRIYNKEMEELSEDIKVCDELTDEVRQEILDIQKQIRRLGTNISPEVEQELLNKIASKNEDLEYLKVVKLESIRDLEHDSIELNSLNSKQIRFTELRSKLVNSLDKRNNIDVSKKRLDELELFNLKSNLKALQNREIYIASLYEDFDSIINPKTTKPTMDVEENISINNLTEEDNDKIQDFINSIENVSPVKNDSENNDELEYSELEDSKKIEEPQIEKNEVETDPLGLGDTRNMKFKDLGEDEKKRKKAENKGFIKSLKKWMMIVASVVAAALGLINIMKGIHNNNFDSKLKEAQENPTKYEDMTEDEIKDSIKDDLQSLDVSLETDKQNNVMPSGNNNDFVDDKSNSKNDDIKVDKMDSEVIAPINPVESTTTIINKNIPMEEQKQILAEQGIYETPDVPVTTVVDKPVYDNTNDEGSYGEFYDNNDNKDDSYGEFHEDDTNKENENTVDSEKDKSPEVSNGDDEWGEFYEDDVVKPETPQEEPATEPSTPEDNTVTEPSIPEDNTVTDPVADDNVMNVNINNGESFVVKLGDQNYEANNGNQQYVEGASSLIDLPGIRNLVEDDKGTVQVEIAGDTVDQLKRDTPLTAADIQKIRDEIAAQYGMTPITEEDVKNANDQYQEQLSQEQVKNR